MTKPLESEARVRPLHTSAIYNGASNSGPCNIGDSPTGIIVILFKKGALQQVPLQVFKYLQIHVKDETPEVY